MVHMKHQNSRTTRHTNIIVVVSHCLVCEFMVLKHEI